MPGIERKFLLAAALSGVLLPAPAFAGDWNGFSVGIGGGYRMTDTRAQEGIAVPDGGLGATTDGWPSSGGLFTLGAGYDRELSNSLLAGGFIDYDFSDVGSSSTYEIGNQLSVGGRLGYLVSPSTLFFSTFGYAHADATKLSVDSILEDQSNVKGGFDGYFVGSGIETLIGGGFSVKAEYRYTSFESRGDKQMLGPDETVSVSSRPTIQTARVSLNYRFGSGGESPATDTSSSVTTGWTSPYLGIGGGAGTADTKIGADVLGSTHLGSDGGLLLLTAGYDYQLNSRFVVGAFGDADYTNFRYKAAYKTTFDSLSETATIDNNFRNLLMIGGRIGYLSSPGTLLFVSGGYANAGLSDTRLGFSLEGIDEPLPSAIFEGKRYSGGFIGGGIEARFTDTLSLKAEYRYLDFGSEDVRLTVAPIPGDFVQTTFDPSMQIGMLSLNYRFGGHPEPAAPLK